MIAVGAAVLTPQALGTSASTRSQLSCLAAARSFGAAVATSEFLDSACCIDELLFPGEKRMATSADTDLNVTTRRARVIHRAACADHVGLVVLWMNIRFHVPKTSAKRSRLGQIRKA